MQTRFYRGLKLECFKILLRLRSEILRFKYSDEVQKSTWSQMGSLKTARFGSLALPLPNVDRFLLLGGKSNSTIGKNSKVDGYRLVRPGLLQKTVHYIQSTTHFEINSASQLTNIFQNYHLLKYFQSEMKVWWSQHQLGSD